MEYKNGVVVDGYVWYNGELHKSKLSDDINQAMVTIEKISRNVYGVEPLMTCGIEGSHSKNSLHPKGDAIDLRSWIYEKDKIWEMIELWEKALGMDYDIVYHEPGNPQKIAAHFHIEYDPK